MKIGKKAVNILGIALIYTLVSTCVVMIPSDFIATSSYFNAKGDVNAAISTLKPEEIISIDEAGFDAKKWMETGNTGIYICNIRDDDKPVIVYFEVLGNIRDLVGGINPMKIYPGENGSELVMPIRDISLFELKDNVFSGTILVRALNDYVKDLKIGIPEIEGNDLLSIRVNQYPYGSDMSIMMMQNGRSIDIDIFDKYDIKTYEDMVSFINDFELLEERFGELENAYDLLIIEKETLLKDKEILEMDKEALQKKKEELTRAKEALIAEREVLTHRYNDIYDEVLRHRNHVCPSPKIVSSPTPTQPHANNTQPVTEPGSVPSDGNAQPGTEPGTMPTDESSQPVTEPDTIPTDDNVQQGEEPVEEERKEDDSNTGDLGPDSVDVIDNNGKDEDKGNDVIDDGDDDAVPHDKEPQTEAENISGILRDMASHLKKFA